MLAILLIIALLPAPLAGQRVHDFAGILPAESQARLEAISLELEQLTTAELAVVSVVGMWRPTMA